MFIDLIVDEGDSILFLGSKRNFVTIIFLSWIFKDGDGEVSDASKWSLRQETKPYMELLTSDE